MTGVFVNIINGHNVCLGQKINLQHTAQYKAQFKGFYTDFGEGI